MRDPKFAASPGRFAASPGRIFAPSPGRASRRPPPESGFISPPGIEVAKLLEGHPHIQQVSREWRHASRAAAAAGPDQMEPLAETLADELAKRGRFEENEAAHILLQVAQALAFCHLKGVLHRSVSLEHCFLAEDPDLILKKSKFGKEKKKGRRRFAPLSPATTPTGVSRRDVTGAEPFEDVGNGGFSPAGGGGGFRRRHDRKSTRQGHSASAPASPGREFWFSPSPARRVNGTETVYMAENGTGNGAGFGTWFGGSHGTDNGTENGTETPASVPNSPSREGWRKPRRTKLHGTKSLRLLPSETEGFHEGIAEISISIPKSPSGFISSIFSPSPPNPNWHMETAARPPAQAQSKKALIVKLGGFDSSLILGLADPQVTELPPRGSRFPFLAWEIVSGKPYGQKSDVWSLGVVLHLLLSGKPPFHSGVNLRHGSASLHLRFGEGRWPWVSPAAKNLLRRMLDPAPSKRPTVLEVLNDPWLVAATAPPASEAGEVGQEVSSKEKEAEKEKEEGGGVPLSLPVENDQDTFSVVVEEEEKVPIISPRREEPSACLKEGVKEEPPAPPPAVDCTPPADPASGDDKENSPKKKKHRSRFFGYLFQGCLLQKSRAE